MAYLGFSRKRSHDDIDDGDECLPISKRINSLHIEGQSSTGIQVSASENNQDGFPCMNSIVSESVSDSLSAVSSELYVSGSQQPRLSNLIRLPRIDENMFQEREFGIRMDQQNLGSFSHQNHSTEASCSEYLYNRCGQLMENTNQQNFSLPDPALSSFQHSPRQELLLPQAHQRTAHLYQSHSHSHTFNHQNIGRLQHHFTFPNHEQEQPRAEGFMDSQQHFTSSNAINNFPEQQQHGGTKTSPTISKEKYMNSNLELPFEESSISIRSDFQKEQLPTGNYEPELGLTENPFYFSVNQMLYEAHVSKVRRMNQFPGSS